MAEVTITVSGPAKSGKSYIIEFLRHALFSRVREIVVPENHHVPEAIRVPLMASVVIKEETVLKSGEVVHA